MIEHEPLMFSFPSTIGEIDTAVGRIMAFAAQAAFDEQALFAIDMAARETLANAVKHGNELDPEKPVEVRLSVDDEGLQIEVRDHGGGFDPDEVPDPTNPDNLLKGSGRGMLFIRNFMDNVAWKPHPDGGTVVSMSKIR